MEPILANKEIAMPEPKGIERIKVNITDDGSVIIVIETMDQPAKVTLVEKEVDLLINKLTRAKDDAKETALATKKLFSIRKNYNSIGR